MRIDDDEARIEEFGPPASAMALSPTSKSVSSESVHSRGVGAITTPAPPVISSFNSELVQALGHNSFENTKATQEPNQSGENRDVYYILPEVGDEEGSFPSGNTANGGITPVVHTTGTKKKKNKRKKSKKVVLDEEETQTSLNKRQRNTPEPITSFSSIPAVFSSGPFGAPCWSSVSRSIPADPVQFTFGSTAFAPSRPSAFGSMHTPSLGSTAFSGLPLSSFGSMQGPTFDSTAVTTSSHIRFGTTTVASPAGITSVNTAPTQSLGSTTFSNVLAPSILGSLQAPSAITSASTGPAQSLGPTIFTGAFGASKPPTLGSVQAPSAITSVGKPAQSLGPTIFTSAFDASKPPTFGSVEAPSAMTLVSTRPALSLCSTKITGEFDASRPPTFGSVQAPSAITSVNTGPAQSLGPTTFTGAVGASKSPPFGPVQAPSTITSVSSGPALSLCSTILTGAFCASKPSIFGSLQAPSYITSVSTGPEQSLAPTNFGTGLFGASTPSAFGSIQAPSQDSFGFGAYAASRPSIFGSIHAPVQVSSDSGASTISSPMRFGSAPAFKSVSSEATQALDRNALGCNAFGLMQSSVQVSSGSGASTITSPVTIGSAQSLTSVTSSPTQALGQNALGCNTFGSMQAPVQVSSGCGASTISSLMRFGSAPAFTSVSSAATQDLGRNTLGCNALGSMQAPVQLSSGFGASTSSSLMRFVSAPAFTSVRSAPTQALGRNSFVNNPFGSMQAPVKATFGSDASSASKSFSFEPPHGNMSSSASGSFPAGVTTSLSSVFGQTNAGFSTLFPSSCAASSSTTVAAAHMSPLRSGAQRPNETTAAHTSGCTACGGTTSSSASGCFNLNSATMPPLAAATPISGLFFPSFGSFPVILGTDPPLQAYPVHGFVLLPFTSMNQQ